MISCMTFTNFVMSYKISYMIYAVLSPPLMHAFPLWCRHCRSRRNPLSQLHVILKKVDPWTQIMQSYTTMTFCLICYIWYHIWHHQVTYDIIYCNVWHQIVISYEIIFSILCDIILHGRRFGALGSALACLVFKQKMYIILMIWMEYNSVSHLVSCQSDCFSGCRPGFESLQHPRVFCNFFHAWISPKKSSKKAAPMISYTVISYWDIICPVH